MKTKEKNENQKPKRIVATTSCKIALFIIPSIYTNIPKILIIVYIPISYIYIYAIYIYSLVYL